MKDFHAELAGFGAAAPVLMDDFIVDFVRHSSLHSLAKNGQIEEMSPLVKVAARKGSLI